ncbi:MAG: triose-phosphate isomerase family protein [bacterium]|nr:triose-phosphate isomerase family protein [bacterium]
MRYIIGNWKANLNLEEVDNFCQEWNVATPNEKTVALAVPCVFYAYLATRKIGFTPILQDISIFGENGARTGEITVENLRGIEPPFTLVGHSERRRDFGETNEVIVAKAKNLMRAKITPIICFDLEQMEELAKLLQEFAPKTYLLAYEPVDAIGTGKNLSGELLQAQFKLIRQVFAPGTKILYGGSVKAENVAQYHDLSDGVLVGGASLKPQEFAQIVERA